MAKSEWEKFYSVTSVEEKFNHLDLCLAYATDAQTRAEKKNSELLTQKEWVSFKKEIKYEGYFYFQEAGYSDELRDLKRKYCLFISNGEEEYLLDSQLKLKVPENKKIDSLFYGMPTGKEMVKREFAEEELKMLALINKERKKLGLTEMILDSSLSAACSYHAYDMGTQNYINHFGYDLDKDGRVYFASYTFDRIRRFYNKTPLLGENISWGRDNAHFTYKGWYNSPGHNKIMFNPLNRLVGIAMVYVSNSEKEYYWVLCTAE